MGTLRKQLKQPKQRKRKQAYRRDRPNAKLHYEGAALISIPESTRITGLGLSLSYKMVREGTLPAAKVNGRWYVLRLKLAEWLDTLGVTRSAA